jgi:hypothetical protein
MVFLPIHFIIGFFLFSRRLRSVSTLTSSRLSWRTARMWLELPAAESGRIWGISPFPFIIIHIFSIYIYSIPLL